MTRPFFLLTAASLCSFINTTEIDKSPKKHILPSQHTVPQKATAISIYDKDTINISTDDSIVTKYSRADLKRIVEKNPELNDDRSLPPDICWGESLKISSDYDCEACGDDYYVLYAYFLREKNGEATYRQQRKTLIELYRDINCLFGRLNGGGTYYGHQYARILGYAEYSISVYIYQNEYAAVKSYHIAKQKELYLKSLLQFIDDEVNNNPELSPVEKAKRMEELVKKTNDIGRLITTRFYLEMAQEFQYSHY